MKNLGYIANKKSISSDEFTEIIGKNKKISIDFWTDVNTLIETSGYEQMNDYLDDLINQYCPLLPAIIVDISYKFVGKAKGQLFTVRATFSLDYF